MRTIVVSLIALAVAAPARAQLQIELSAPSITFQAPPPLVEVSPGVQVVQDYDQEVYFTGGWYWVRHGKHWYRTQDHRGGWAVVGEHEVPALIVKTPKGKYQRYKAPKPPKRAIVVAPNGEVLEVKIKKGKKGKH